MERLNTAVVPGGIMGTALARVLRDNNHLVTLYFHTPLDTEIFSQTLCNNRKLPNLIFEPDVMATSCLEEAVLGKEVIILVPSIKHIRPIFTRINQINNQAIVICATKGLEQHSNMQVSQILSEIDPEVSHRLVMLSGPNFAAELAQRKPMSTDTASTNEFALKIASQVFHNNYFRVYPQDDIIGVELGGALKNIVAIGAGICDGLELGISTKCSMITKTLPEITQFGVVLGATEKTFNGLSGIGDLIATCMSPLSRNYQAGLAIAHGTDPKTLICSGRTIEGLYTAPVAIEIARQNNLYIPIMEKIWEVTHLGKIPTQAVQELMQRPIY